MRTNVRKFSLALTSLMLVALLLGLSVGIISADPGTVYVDGTQGTDGAGCGASPGPNACKTIQYAITNIAVADDTINVAAGTYNEDVTVNKSLTLNGAQAGVDARGRSASESEIVGVVKVTSAATNVVFDGFKFTSPTRGFTPRGFNLRVESENSTIKNCIFVAEENAGHTYSGYLDFGGITNTTVERNSFSGDLDPTQEPNVILLYITGAGTVTVADNEMHDVGGGGGVGIMCSNDSAVINIEDNEFDNTGDGIWIWTFLPQTFSVSITGNDIHDCSKIGVKLVGGSVGEVHINHNNIYNNLQGGCVNQVATSVDATCNWWGAADGPGPVGPGSGDTVSTNVTFTPWLIGMAPGGLCIGGTPKGSKVSVVSDLSALLPTDDKKTDDRIEKAIYHLTKSLDPKYWLDGSHLTKKGQKVFEEEKKAVHELMKIDTPDVLAEINALVSADENLAQTAIDDAAGGDQKDIDKAEEEMTKAQDELDKGHFDKAIEHYKKAWHHAQEAMK